VIDSLFDIVAGLAGGSGKKDAPAVTVKQTATQEQDIDFSPEITVDVDTRPIAVLMADQSARMSQALAAIAARDQAPAAPAMGKFYVLGVLAFLSYLYFKIGENLE
jgi:hypothetical protein